MNKQKILVLGGTGKTGRKVVEKLKDLGIDTRVGSRSVNPAFDWEDSSNWEEVLDGVNRIYITYQPDLAVPGALDSIKTLIGIVKRKKIEKVVLLSGKGEKEAELCEQVVINSGTDYIILRCSWFSQNFSESFFLDPIISGHVALPKADTQVPYVDTSDIADVATEVLVNDAFTNQVFELTGPQSYTFREVINMISAATSREIKFTEIDLPSYVKSMKNASVPDEYIWLINYLFTNVLDAPGNNIVSHDIERVLGRPPKSFEQYVFETAQTSVWRKLVNRMND